MIQAVLSNPDHPTYGVVTVSFPIEKEEYPDAIKRLQDIEIGDVMSRDCLVGEVTGDWPALKRLECVAVNVDELDYLAKRLDSFSTEEKAKFQAMAVAQNYSDAEDLINLTFCCQQATVITDFSDLAKVGRNRFMDLNGGIAFQAQLDACDPYRLAMKLLESEEGKITPYGVVYDNGMELEQIYTGQSFPEYWYDDFAIEVGVLADGAEESDMTWLYLPLSQSAIDRTLLRSGIQDGAVIHRLQGDIPNRLCYGLDLSRTTLTELNNLALALSKLDDVQLCAFDAAAEFAKPASAAQFQNLAENITLFDFAPGVQDAEGYGRHMIQDSGHFEFDENLEGFYDYSKYGRQRMEQEQGAFVDGGYISYHGVVSIPELLAGVQCERMDFEMGGIQ